MIGLVIEAVTVGSVSSEFEVGPGDRLLAVNGHPLRDIIDYSYYTSGCGELLLEILKPNNEIWELEIQRELCEPIGLIFNAPAPAHCRNNCIFCFVHQLPKGLRKPLYVKDEDFRLSFLNGNYVTLTNLRPTELARIIEQRLSPLYISVHSTNPAIRQKLLGRQGIPPILEQLQILADANITMHTQIVLCPGINDKQELTQTVSDMAKFFPAVQSLAIVPLGLTRHRRNLPQLQAVDNKYAKDFISEWEPRCRILKKKMGRPFLFLADEFYIKGGIPYPHLREYGDLPQIENGIGMVPLFLRKASQTIQSARYVGDFRVTVVTGVSCFAIISEFVTKLSKKTGLSITPVAVINRLFGESVSVSGLLTGNDIIAALKDLDIGRALLVPDVMLKEGEGIFLDDMSLASLEEKLLCKVVQFDTTPHGLYRVLQLLR